MRYMRFGHAGTAHSPPSSHCSGVSQSLSVCSSHAALRARRHAAGGGHGQAGGGVLPLRSVQKLQRHACECPPGAAPCDWHSHAWRSRPRTELAQAKNTYACTSEARSPAPLCSCWTLTLTPDSQAFLQGYGVEPMLPDGTRVSTLQADARRERATVRARRSLLPAAPPGQDM